MSLIAWQGWQLEVPTDWNPVRLSGDWRAGELLLADLQRPRLGLRWRSAGGRRFDAQAAVARALWQEVGQLAADEAEAMPLEGWSVSRLYVEPKPPGRDVWIGYSGISGRMIELVYHAQRRDRLLGEDILPTLRDCDPSRAMPWAVFDLSCIIPAGMSLQRQQLLAGDLNLIFADKRWRLMVRQIAVAELALKRMPLERWLARQQMQDKHYRASGMTRAVTLHTEQRELKGVAGRSRRRRRFFWMSSLPPALTTYALHDPQRDRLVVLEANDEALIESVAATVGWATTSQPVQ